MFRDVDFLQVVIKLDGLTTLCFAVEAGLIFFVRQLRVVIIGVFIKYFTLLRGVSRAMKQSCFSRTGRLLACRDFIFCLALASASLLGVGR